MHVLHTVLTKAIDPSSRTMFGKVHAEVFEYCQIITLGLMLTQMCVDIKQLIVIFMIIEHLSEITNSIEKCIIK